jgi:two-component system response regulator QseB/two-component system response regulator BasR
MHILLIEDDLDLGRALQKALQAEGISSEWLRRVADAPLDPDACDAACILLDVSLPDGTGFELLRRWRAGGARKPVLIITARSALEDRLRGLDGGADDFIVKPFAAEELVSRIRAVIRRSAQQATEQWRWGELVVEPRSHRASLRGADAALTLREFRLLFELVRQPGSVVSKNILAQRLDPLGEPADFATLEVHLSNLRRKIGAEWIRTVRGVGYLFQP